MIKTRTVIEGWTGPGRRDATISQLTPAEDGLHIDLDRRGMFEWWYFDARLDTGHTIVVFFHASNPNPGQTGKTDIEIILLRPDGSKFQRVFPYRKSEFSANRDQPDICIGRNTMRMIESNTGLPIYEVDIHEQEIGLHLLFQAQVNGWKPGNGISQFGDLGYFAWVVPFARAAVEGTITDGNQETPVTGIGYHDHNWLNFQFPKIIRYWMWGRIYSQGYTISYAIIQCNDRVDNHTVKVLMMAEGKEVVLSSGELECVTQEFEYNDRAKYQYPRKLVLSVSGELRVTLQVKKVLEAEDMLENFNPLVGFLARRVLHLKPGYFRLLSNFEIEVMRDGRLNTETGEAMHEIVLFKAL